MDIAGARVRAHSETKGEHLTIKGKVETDHLGRYLDMKNRS